MEKHKTPLRKIEKKDKKYNYRPVSILPTLSNFLKNTCLVRCLLILMKYFRNINMVLEMGTVLNNVF